MKTALLYKSILALLMPVFLFAGTGNWKGKHSKDKVIKEIFSVNSNATLKVDNSYGNIDIITWNENKIDIEVIIKVNGNNEEKVQKKLDEISVDFESSSNEVYAKTIFNKNKSKSWFSWGNSNVNMKINYIIKMPITNNVDLSNDYGSINLDKLEGRAEISCDYGKITTKELMADNNVIKFDYTNNSYFEYIKSGEIVADYSGYTVAKANKLAIKADYTKSKIEIAEDIIYNCDYGGITIEKANNITGKSAYLTTRFGDVYKNVAIKADYGSLKIDNMTSNAGDVAIQSDYMKITIGYDAGYNFSFDFELDYASLNGKDNLEIQKQRIESGDKYYSGYYGSPNSGNNIIIKSDYGSVTLKRN